MKKQKANELDLLKRIEDLERRISVIEMTRPTVQYVPYQPYQPWTPPINPIPPYYYNSGAGTFDNKYPLGIQL